MRDQPSVRPASCSSARAPGVSELVQDAAQLAQRRLVQRRLVQDVGNAAALETLDHRGGPAAQSVEVRLVGHESGRGGVRGCTPWRAIQPMVS